MKKLILGICLGLVSASGWAQATLPRTHVSGLQVGDEQTVRLNTDRVVWFDDFLGDVLQDEYTTPEGTDTDTADQAIVAGTQHGIVRLTTGDVATPTVAANGSAIVLGRHWQTDQSSDTWEHDRLIFEARMKLTGTIASYQVCIGLTDAITLEMPATISGTTITTNFSDGIVFAADSNATTDQWYAVGVKGDTDSTSNVITGTANTAGTYQYFRIVVDSDENAYMYISADEYFSSSDLVATLVDAVTETTLLTPVFVISSTDASESVTADLDYWYIGALRD